MPNLLSVLEELRARAQHFDDGASFLLPVAGRQGSPEESQVERRELGIDLGFFRLSHEQLESSRTDPHRKIGGSRTFPSE